MFEKTLQTYETKNIELIFPIHDAARLMLNKYWDIHERINTQKRTKEHLTLRMDNMMTTINILYEERNLLFRQLQEANKQLHSLAVERHNAMHAMNKSGYFKFVEKEKKQL